MELVTSRDYILPTKAKDLSAGGPWYNLWGRQEWPYRELQNGMTLYWYESPSKMVVWRTRVVRTVRFPYERKDEVSKKLNLTSEAIAQDYYVKARSTGFCLSYEVEALDRLDIPKPGGLDKFPRLGWLRIAHVEQEWPGLSAVSSSGFSLPEEIAISPKLPDGAVRRVTVNAYERNPEARQRCINAHGTKCCICEFDFGMEYGDVADGHIHVHHLTPLAKIGKEYQVDPEADLRPVCPNCHAVIHLGGVCRTVEEVKRLRENALSRRNR